ncbi:hypothetical protein WN943_011612 [Citrus x changshan-huyou]
MHFTPSNEFNCSQFFAIFKLCSSSWDCSVFQFSLFLSFSLERGSLFGCGSLSRLGSVFGSGSLSHRGSLSLALGLSSAVALSLTAGLSHPASHSSRCSLLRLSLVVDLSRASRWVSLSLSAL